MIIVLAIVLFCPFSPVAAEERRPTNVLLIAIDDLNDWIGCLGGHPQTKTPNIDALARRGVLFTNAHCAAPACNPSRAALFSGLWPKQTGVWSNDSPKLPQHRPDLELLPVTFKRHGYATVGTGKLLHGGANTSGRIFDQTYFPEQRWSPLLRSEVDYAADEVASKKSDSPRHVVRRQGGSIVLPLNGMPSDRNPDTKTGESFDWGPFDVADAEMGDTKITDWSVQKLEGGFDRPFFLGVGYYRPHIPLWVPKKYFDLIDEEIQLPVTTQHDLDDLSPTAKKWAVEPVTAGSHATVVKHRQWHAAVRAYLASVSYADHEVGRLLDALDQSQYADNTMIVLLSDHGWHLGEKQHWGKWTGWERSTRVPLIVVPPKRHAEEYAVGSTCARPVNLIDIYPTLAEACDVQAPADLVGRSLVPLLRDPHAEPMRISVTIFDQGNISIRTQDARYIRYADGSEEFYDHSADPHEWHNLMEDESREQEILHARSIADQLSSRR